MHLCQGDWYGQLLSLFSSEIWAILNILRQLVADLAPLQTTFVCGTGGPSTDFPSTEGYNYCVDNTTCPCGTCCYCECELPIERELPEDLPATCASVDHQENDSFDGEYLATNSVWNGVPVYRKSDGLLPSRYLFRETNDDGIGRSVWVMQAAPPDDTGRAASYCVCNE
jgi:hypothetical protein